jgi:signal transduction histidine kinase
MSTPRPPKLPDTTPEPAASLSDQIIELSALTGGLAHEIRNPLSTLKVNLQLLDEDWRHIECPDDAQAAPDPQDVARRSRRRLATLLAESHRLERILEDFLQYVGRRELHLEPHDLNDLVCEMCDFYEPQAASKGLTLETRLADVPIVCNVDRSAIKQVLLNLLINAQQAMPDGGDVCIAVSVDNGRDVSDSSSNPATAFGRIDVMDNGPGIPPELRDRIFEAYFSTRKGGTGLGLAMARQTIRQHHGRICVFSQPGEGTCFSILLPLCPH